MKIKDANKGLERQLTVQTWVIASVGLILAVIGLAPMVAKLLT